MHKNYFDIVMAHIEENVNKSTNEIKRDIPLLIGRNHRGFEEMFFIMTGYTLANYIGERRLLYAVRDLVFKPRKSIVEIAQEYQFSDQAAFSRAVKAKYHFTPREMRENTVVIDEAPFCLSMFANKANDPEIEQVLHRMEIGNEVVEEVNQLIEIEEIDREFGLGWDTCWKIMDLAERLDIPFAYLYNVCAHAYMEAHSEGEGFQSEMEEIKKEIWLQEMDLESEEEADRICAFFHTENGAINEAMIQRYRELHRQKTEGNDDHSTGSGEESAAH